MIPINEQAPLKQDLTADGTLLVHDIFYTIQGEGPHAGSPAVFIRLAGCNLQCPGCDTDYSGHHRMYVVDILSKLTNFDFMKTPLVVITGGEPFRQNIMALIRSLNTCGFMVQIETNGTLGIPMGEDYDDLVFGIVVSPKAGKVHPSLYDRIIAYKYILDAASVDTDGLPLTTLGLPGKPARPHSDYKGPIYVQPADENAKGGTAELWFTTKNIANMDACILSALRFGYKISIQIHKMIGMP